MIKSFLYSIFLHSFLLAIIYLSFNLENFKEAESKEITIDLISYKEEKKPEAIIEPIIKPKKSEQFKEKSKKPRQPKQKKKEKPKKVEKKPKKKVKKVNKEIKVIKKVKPKKEPIKNTIEGLNLLAREKINIRSQLQNCYIRAIKESGAKNKLSIIVEIKIDKKGNIKSNIDKIIDKKRYEDPEDKIYKISIDNSKRALEICNPLRNLPANKYDIWKEILIEFGKNKKKIKKKYEENQEYKANRPNLSPSSKK